MSEYEPELGQALLGNPAGEYAMPAWVEALWDGIVGEIERVYWNEHQRVMRETCDERIWPFGLTWRAYWWGDADSARAAQPNMEYRDVEIRWYKHPARGLSCNVRMTPDEWAAWTTALLADLKAYDIGTSAGRAERPLRSD